MCRPIHFFLYDMCLCQQEEVSKLIGGEHMKHPYEKFIIAEMASIFLAILIGLVALLKGFVLLVFIALYCIAISFICEGLVEWSKRQAALAGKHFLRAFIVIVLASYLILKF